MQKPAHQPRPVVDLHCDLLAHLGYDPSHTVDDWDSRASRPSLQSGGVRLQVLPIFTDGGGRRDALPWAQAQIAAYHKILESDEFAPAKRPPSSPSSIGVALAVENLASLFGYEEALEIGLARLRRLHEGAAGPLAYVSLTWAGENRFGGGNGSKKGLSGDGRRALETLIELGIPVDFSHTSDALAGDVLAAIDQIDSSASVLASHSNLRSIAPSIRNLTDELAGQIVSRGGLIGLTAIAAFVGRAAGIAGFVDHVRHGLSIGAEGHLAFGLDYFNPNLLPDRSARKLRFFFDGYRDASCYPSLLAMVQRDVAELDIDGLRGRNAVRWLIRNEIADPSWEAVLTPSRSGD